MSDIDLAAALRPVAEVLVTPESVRREREHDRAIERGGRVRGERVAGRLPPGAAGVVQAASIQVPPSGMSASENLGEHLGDVETEIGGKLTNPLSGAPGELVISGPDGEPAALPLGGEGQVLAVVDGAPAYVDAAFGGGAAWSVMTNGDAAAPEIVFVDGDVVMVEERV